MTLEEFGSLVDRRDALREQHQAYCDDVNGILGTGENSQEARSRDRVWKELQELNQAIEAERSGQD